MLKCFNIINFTLPASALTGTTFARFRFTSYNTNGELGFTGPANDGEVEDYMIEIVNEQDESKIHNPQWPDLTTNGVDAYCMDAQNWNVRIADDFVCKETGLITGIHIWGSWLNDVVPVYNNMPSFKLKIWSNNQNGPGGYSQPDEILASYYFEPGAYTMEQYADVPDGEWFYWPPGNQATFPGDFKVWKLKRRINAGGNYARIKVRCGRTWRHRNSPGSRTPCP